jgi:hypothetical protein
LNAVLDLSRGVCKGKFGEVNMVLAMRAERMALVEEAPNQIRRSVDLRSNNKKSRPHAIYRKDQGNLVGASSRGAVVERQNDIALGKMIISV